MLQSKGRLSGEDLCRLPFRETCSTIIHPSCQLSNSFLLRGSGCRGDLPQRLVGKVSRSQRGGGGVSVGTQAPGYGLGLCHNTTFRGVQEFLNTEGVEKHFRLLPIRG